MICIFFEQPEVGLLERCNKFKRLRAKYKEEEGPERLMEIINETFDGSLDKFAEAYVNKVKGRELKDYMNTWVSYAVRLDVFKYVGGYDENYKKAGYEDWDLARRLNMLGFRTAVTYSSFVWHCVGTTRPHIGGAVEAETSNGIYYRKKFSRPNVELRGSWGGVNERTNYV